MTQELGVNNSPYRDNVGAPDLKENPTTELLARFREEVSHGRMWGSVDSFENFLATHTLSKKEVARVIEELREKHKGDREHICFVECEKCERQIEKLSKALGLGEESV